MCIQSRPAHSTESKPLWEDPRAIGILQELTEGRDAITRLMTTLDDRKHECLHRTFKDVAKAFFDVFKELVPAGEGNLVMERPVNAEYSGVKV